jgi:hypothetical protein
MKNQYLVLFLNPYIMLMLVSLRRPERGYGCSNSDEATMPAQELTAFLLCLRSWMNP